MCVAPSYSFPFNMSLLTKTTPYLVYVPLNAEYDAVTASLRKSLGREDVGISVLLKVVNPKLEAAFYERAASIAGARGKEPEIVTVYHGTTMGAAEVIAETGFDATYSRVAAYGKGTYASPNAKLALNYCKDVKDKTDFSMVFQAKFLKGKYGTYGSHAVIDTKLHDYSGNIKDILVTPYNDGILPEYVICYYTWAS